MEKLKESNFNWHAEQPDVPQMSAEEMKQFLDAPTRVLMEKVNEIIGADGSLSAEQLQQLIEETKMETSAEIEQALNSFATGDLSVYLSELKQELEPKIEQNAEDIANVKNYNDIDHEEFGNDLARLREEKQDKLTAGDNVTIDENNVISATGGTADMTGYVQQTDLVGVDGRTVGVISATTNSALPIYAANGSLQLGNNKTRIAGKGNTNAIRNCDLDYAVKIGLSTNAEEWSAQEKAAARELLGIAGETALQSIYTQNGEQTECEGITAEGFAVTELEGYFSLCSKMEDHESLTASLILNGTAVDILEYCGFDATMQNDIGRIGLSARVVSKGGRQYAAVELYPLGDTWPEETEMAEETESKRIYLPLGEAESITEVGLYAWYQMPEETGGESGVSPIVAELELEGA